jgi:hypothetical protein
MHAPPSLRPCVAKQATNKPVMDRAVRMYFDHKFFSWPHPELLCHQASAIVLKSRSRMRNCYIGAPKNICPVRIFLLIILGSQNFQLRFRPQESQPVSLLLLSSFSPLIIRTFLVPRSPPFLKPRWANYDIQCASSLHSSFQIPIRLQDLFFCPSFIFAPSSPRQSFFASIVIIFTPRRHTNEQTNKQTNER